MCLPHSKKVKCFTAKSSRCLNYNGNKMMGMGKELVLAFLASAAGCFDLVKQILPQGMQNIPHSEVDHALKVWSQGHDQPPPQSPHNTRQKYWDGPSAEAVYDELLKAAPDPRARARLFAAATRVRCMAQCLASLQSQTLHRQ